MRRNKQAGQALILTAVALVVLMGFAGLAIDVGALRSQERAQQTAADAAALAGASNLPYGGWLQGAQNAAAGNGFTDNSGNAGACAASGPPAPPNSATPGWIEVSVCNGPTTGPHQNDTKYVEAWVTEVQPTYFMRVLGINQETITARAVATNVAGSPTTGGAGCVDSLGAPTKKLSGVSTSGSVVVDAPTCGINDNGNFVANGGANLSVTAGSIGVSGSYSAPGSPNATITPQPVTGVPAMGDPINATPPCSGSGCAGGGNIKITGGGCSGAGCSGVSCSGSACTVSPGTYGSISIQGQTVNFLQGTYVFDGNFTANGNAVMCNSSTPCTGMPGTANDGVTFYITGNGAVSIDGTSTVQLTAPNSGTYEGMLFYQDPADTQAASLSGNNNTFFQGALYFPTAALSFGGNNSTTGTFNGSAAFTLLIADYVTFAGNPTIELNSNFSGLSGTGGPLASAIATARLVE